jgi:hypothetical protein
MLNPAGSDLVASENVAVPTPPLRPRSVLYGYPDTAPGRLDGVTAKDAGATARLVATESL